MIDDSKDIFVLKAHFLCDDEAIDCAEEFHKAFGNDCEILCLRIGEDEQTDAYWARRDSRIEVEFEKLDENAIIPRYRNEEDVTLSLGFTSMDYDQETDQYVYHTGLKINRMPSGSYVYIKPSGSLHDCYISDYVGFGETDYDGEIIVYFKNRTSFEVRKMLEEWKWMKSNIEEYNINKEQTTGNTLDELKKLTNKEQRELNPYDYAPYNNGEDIAELVFVNVPFVKTIEFQQVNEILNKN